MSFFEGMPVNPLLHEELENQLDGIKSNNAYELKHYDEVWEEPEEEDPDIPMRFKIR